ncbi:CopD family protein [Paracoccus marinaquae]|uniref:Protoporphyrinogen IX oxidase n=1 Tax=Paracoccus marinaquae TaxID=2841926 RepID=A0ABS6AHA7_9RHOB|nr:CopD family protein [Paracoccus marinaquae]MBU3029065.1 CopD family protein [Paracoccus marinaquae]
MTDLLATIYLYVKAFHVMAVMSWMAGLFYLPRLFVYHAERGKTDQEPAASLVIMEDKLLRLIMRPAMIATWLSGIGLVLTPGVVDWSMLWPWVKALCVLGMTWFHGWCATERRGLSAGTSRGGRHYRLMNEVPTLLMIGIVLSVIVKY